MWKLRIILEAPTGCNSMRTALLFLRGLLHAYWLAFFFSWGSVSWNAFILSFHPMSTCSSIQYQFICHSILVPPLFANYLFTCWSAPQTVSGSGNVDLVSHWLPQCLGHSLKVRGLLNKLQDYSKRMSYRVHFCKYIADSRVCFCLHSWLTFLKGRCWWRWCVLS